MADEYSCNSCGELTDTGYFYCEKCRRIHKEKKRKDNDKTEGGSEGKETFISDRGNINEGAINPSLKVKVS